jgi:hypothetical protein
MSACDLEEITAASDAGAALVYLLLLLLQL